MSVAVLCRGGRPSPAKTRHRGWVYLVRVSPTLHKIGESISLEARIESFQKTNPDAELVHAIETNDSKRLELCLQVIHHKAWVKHELYRLGDDVIRGLSTISRFDFRHPQECRVKQHREAAGLTQGGLARLAGVSAVSVKSVESRLGVKWPTVVGIARALGVAYADLYPHDFSKGQTAG